MSTATMDLDVGMDRNLAEKYADVTVRIMRVTPELAAEMLKKNSNNRKLVRRHVELLVDVLDRREWYMNGETIVLSYDDVLLNGQHRLTAIVESGVSADCMVVYGIDPEAFKTIDGGRVRKVGDVLAMAGEENASKVAASVSMFYAVLRRGGSFPESTNAFKVTPSLCQDVLSQHPGLRRSTLQMSRGTLFRGQHSAVLHYLFSLSRPQLAADFADVMADGTSDTHRPFNVLREMLIRTPLRTDNRVEVAAKAVKAFNAEYHGHSPKQFKFLKSEDFPMVAGVCFRTLAASIGFEKV